MSLRFYKYFNFDYLLQIQNSDGDKRQHWNIITPNKSFKSTIGLLFLITSITGYFIPPVTAASNTLVLTKGVPSNLRSSFEEVIEKFYDLNYRVESGINSQKYSNEVSNLKVAFDRLGRKPGAKKFEVYKHLGAALLNYQYAKQLWQFCIEYSDCKNQIININASPSATYLVRKYGIVTIDKKPGYTPDSRRYLRNHIVLSEGLSKIWIVASGHIQKL
jgi:hypothetical protein